MFSISLVSVCRSRKENYGLILPSLDPQSKMGSNRKSRSSSRVMLCMIIHAIMMFDIVAKSHCRIGFFYNLPACLKYTKCALNIFAYALLALREVLFHGPLWLMNGLHKVSPRGINAIREQIKLWINMTIDLKGQVMPCTSQNLPK